MNTIYQGTFRRGPSGHLVPDLGTPRNTKEAEKYRRANSESKPVDLFFQAHLDRFESLKRQDNVTQVDLDPEPGSVVTIDDAVPGRFLEKLAADDAYRATGPAKADSYRVDGTVIVYSQLRFSPETGQITEARLEERNHHLPLDEKDFDPALVGKRKVTTFTAGRLMELNIAKEQFGREGTKMVDTLQLKETERGVFHLLEQSEGVVL